MGMLKSNNIEKSAYIIFGAVPDNVEICYKDQHEEEQIKQVITI